jgi:hypothetical protein
MGILYFMFGKSWFFTVGFFWLCGRLAGFLAKSVPVPVYVASSVPDPVGSGPFWSDPDVRDRFRIRILALINDPISTFFGVCKSHKFFKITCCLTFWFMNILFIAYFGQKKIFEEVCPKIYIGKDLDPDVFKSRIRIRSKIVQIRNTGCISIT